MQSYTLYTTSEFLRDRHPYIPDPNPRPLMDPEQVAIAYNERAVPKLSDLLIYDKLSSDKRLAALHTLNELVSHQETKCDMISNRIVISATNLMKDENADVRFEASFLVGSLLFLDVGRKQFDSEKVNYEIIQKLIFDDVTKVRESIGWLLYRLSLILFVLNTYMLPPFIVYPYTVIYDIGVVCYTVKTIYSATIQSNNITLPRFPPYQLF